MNRRHVLLTSCAASVFGGAVQARAEAFEVYTTPGQACCQAWVAALEATEHSVIAMDLDRPTMAKLGASAGLTRPSCHMAFVEGYVIQGFVPIDIVTRFLGERPDAVGLVARGRWSASRARPLRTLMLRHDGTTTEYPS